METISGGEKPTFKADEVLTAVNLNQATKNWVVTEVPPDSDGNVGDVVFIPGGPGGSTPAVGGGKVLQVVRATDSTDRTTTKTTFEDVTGMSITITPQKTTSAVIIIVSVLSRASGASGGANMTHALRITDSSNNAISGAEDNAMFLQAGGGNLVDQKTATLLAYATPATTNAVTYKLQHRTAAADQTAQVSNATVTGQMYAIELADVVVSP